MLPDSLSRGHKNQFERLYAFNIIFAKTDNIKIYYLFYLNIYLLVSIFVDKG